MLGKKSGVVALAVVVIVIVAIPCAPELTTIGEPSTVQFALAGTPEHVSAMLSWSLLVPPFAVICSE